MARVVVYAARDGRKTYRVRTRDFAGRQTTETFPTEAAAKRFAKVVEAIGGPAAIAERNRTDRAGSDYVPSLAEWLPRYIEQLTRPNDRTRLDYAAMAARTFMPILGKTPVDLIDHAAIAKTVNALAKQGLSDKSVANAHGLLSSAMKAALREGHITRNPCEGVNLPHNDHGERGERFLTFAEYLALLGATPAPHRALVLTLFGTGLRWSEATALQVRDINPNARPAALRVTKAWKATPGRPREIGPPKSPKSRRTVTLGQQVVDELAPLLARPGTDILFTAVRGGPVHHGTWRDRVWVNACIDAGLATPRPASGVYHYDGPRIHDARHSHASWLIEQGASLELVQDQLGHESILTTRRVYGHLQPAMRNALADYATRALAGMAPQIGR